MKMIYVALGGFAVVFAAGAGAATARAAPSQADLVQPPPPVVAVATHRTPGMPDGRTVYAGERPNPPGQPLENFQRPVLNYPSIGGDILRGVGLTDVDTLIRQQG